METRLIVKGQHETYGKFNKFKHPVSFNLSKIDLTFIKILVHPEHNYIFEVTPKVEHHLFRSYFGFSKVNLMLANDRDFIFSMEGFMYTSMWIFERTTLELRPEYTRNSEEWLQNTLPKLYR